MDPETDQSILSEIPESAGKDLKSKIDIPEDVIRALGRSYLTFLLYRVSRPVFYFSKHNPWGGGHLPPHLATPALRGPSSHASHLHSWPCLCSQAHPDEGREVPPYQSGGCHFHSLSKYQAWYKVLYTKISFTRHRDSRRSHLLFTRVGK